MHSTLAMGTLAIGLSCDLDSFFDSLLIGLFHTTNKKCFIHPMLASATCRLPKTFSLLAATLTPSPPKKFRCHPAISSFALNFEAFRLQSCNTSEFYQDLGGMNGFDVEVASPQLCNDESLTA